MGFIHGKEVTVIKSAPLRDPIEYQILGYNVSLRHSEAELIEVVPEEASEEYIAGTDYLKVPDKVSGKPGQGIRELDQAKTKGGHNHREKYNRGTIEVALVGNPNCGKTSIFNLASRSREHTGNYAGVTVEAKIAEIEIENQNFRLTDLPGTYSLSTYSPDELYVRDQLLF